MSTSVIEYRGPLAPAVPGGIADEERRDSDSPRRLILIGSVIAGLFFVVLFGWGSIARLDAAATGEGQVTVLGNRQTLAHREGGVVSELNVREGQHVKAGQVLIELAGEEVRQQERSLSGTVIGLRAQKARLEAELAGRAITWPAEFANASAEDRAIINNVKTLQLRQMNARASSLAATRAVITQQQAQVSEQSLGLAAQSRSADQQRESLKQQLEGMRTIADKGFVSQNTIRALERSIEQLQGTKADYAARVAASREQIGAYSGSYYETQRKIMEDASALLRDTDLQLSDQTPRLLAAQAQLRRLRIRAPVAGTVVGLQVFTRGGVIQAGQPLMDLVPDAAPLVVRAAFNPTDIDGVRPGIKAQVRFASIHERDLPILFGTVRTVSADTLADKQSGRPFFSADIEIPDAEIAKIRAVRGRDTGIRVGVPVNITVPLRKRTALEYVLEPLTGAFSKSLHER
jgi:HlyD family secretion protein